MSKADYLKKAEGDRPTVVFIKNPNELFNRIRRFFNKFGIRDEEIIISPVQYTEKRKISMSLLDYPKELLLKDKCFEEQSEVRIIVNSNNKEYLDYMEKNNNIISVGNIEDIAEIYLIDVLSSRSNCYSRLGKYDLALKDLERLQELIGYNYQIYTSKEVNYIYLNNLTQAIEEFNKSINMIENNPDAYYNRSVAYYRLNKYKDAKNDIEKALVYNTTNDFYKKAYEDFYNK